jgi:hypothetical protein
MRLCDLRFGELEIGRRDQSPTRRTKLRKHACAQLGRHRARLGERRQRRSQPRVANQRADCRRLIVPDALGDLVEARRIATQDRPQQLEGPRRHAIEHHPITRERDAGCGEARERQRTKATGREREPFERQRDRDRGSPDMKGLLGRAEVDLDRLKVDALGSTPRARKRREEVDRQRLGAGLSNQHDPRTAGRGQQRLGHERREHARDRSVDGVATFTQHLRRSPSREHTPRRNDASHGTRV